MVKVSNQVVGNIGLYYVCYELSRRGWNVLTTSRNARGVDVVIYNQSGTETHTIQVKSLAGRNAVGGMNPENQIAEFLIVCRKVFEDKPECFIARIDEIKNLITSNVGKDGKTKYWLNYKNYEQFREKWDEIGDGYH